MSSPAVVGAMSHAVAWSNHQSTSVCVDTAEVTSQNITKEK